MKKRTRLEVIRDLLEVLQKNKQVKITHLIYKANLSNNSIKPYIEYLLKNNLAEQTIVDEKRMFKITLKGNEFLLEFNKIKIFSDSYGL
ncbi:Winged helix-turn-helix [uncultured archaeon]|nr:Winged helix-turn-helix [uncultured archaeon]